MRIIILFVGLFLMYSLSIMPQVPADKDSGEFTLVLATYGVPHPTGYPLYTIGGSLFVRLAFFALRIGWDHAAALFSLLGSLVALCFGLRCCRDCCRLVAIPAHRQWPFFLVVTATAAVNPAFAHETTLAEVYTWHLAWTALACACFVRWMGALIGSDLSPARIRRLVFGWGVITGLGLSHHLTSLFLIVPCSLALLVAVRRKSGAGTSPTPFLLLGLLGTSLPLLSYGYVAWRAFHPTELSTWPGLEPSWNSIWGHISGAQYRHYLWGFNPSPAQRVLLMGGIAPLLAVLLPLGLWALAAGKRDPARLILAGLVGGMVCLTAYAFSYGVPDPASYFLAPIMVGLAISPLLWRSLSSSRKDRPAHKPLAPAMALGALFLVGLAALMPGWHSTNRERQRVLRAHDALVRNMWQAIPDIEAFVFWPDDMVYRLHVFQKLEGSKTQLRLYATDLLLHPPQREKMMREEGIDPWLGFHDPALSSRVTDSRVVGNASDPRARALAVVHESVNVQTPLPVILFDPAQQSVRILKKPEAD